MGMKAASELNVKIFADGADLKGISNLSRNPVIKGFTTNPTLMRKAGIQDYRGFAREVLGIIGERPVSFEVFSDDFAEMEKQAMEIASWGPNVYVKIPVTNTRREFAGELIRSLARTGVQVNITALLSNEQVRAVLECLSPQTRSCVSVFARSRPGSAHGRGRPVAQSEFEGGADLGQPARTPEHLPRGRGGLSHHHGNA